MRGTWLAAGMAAVLPLIAVADDRSTLGSLGTPVDLTAGKAADTVTFAGLLEPVGLVRGDDGTPNRFYVAPIVGASWGQAFIQGDPATDSSLFTAGGAAGVAVARPYGQWRFEGEGRYRDGASRSLDAGPVAIAFGITDNWSALFNVWRDVPVTENFGVYGGGGIGAGGTRFFLTQTAGVTVVAANEQGSAFAWQIGGGCLYALSDRITLDLGYRYYNLDAADSTFFLSNAGSPPVPIGSLSSTFLASELLLSIRIYEPLRNLW